MSGILLADPADSANYQFEWADLLAPLEQIGQVTHTVPSPLTKVGESTDAAGSKSTVKVSGVKHGGAYLIEAQCTTTAGQVLNRQGLIRGFNG